MNTSQNIDYPVGFKPNSKLATGFLSTLIATAQTKTPSVLLTVLTKH